MRQTPYTVRALLGWALACCLALAAIWIAERNARVSTLIAESERLHAAASQRVDQHDAHLTALSAVAVAGAEERPDLFLDVAGAIMRFYPRVTGVHLVPLEPEGATLRIGAPVAEVDALVRQAARRSTGAPVLVRSPSGTPGYLIVKRSPNSEAARYALALGIDAAQLLQGDAGDWTGAPAALRLSLPGDLPLLTQGAGLDAPQFAKALSSNTQPLLLETAVTLLPADLLPPGKVAAAIVLITLAALILRGVLRQRAKVQAAEKRAELSGLESRLSHASRVNALGEMASGMAHELTQPLTAILARTQAARHLAARGDTDRLAPVLDEVVVQTKRASAILERLRTWTRPQERRPAPIDLRDCVQVAETLLAAQAAEIGATLRVLAPQAAVPVVADQVEIEQVLFNLIRNALEALAEVEGPREVAISLAPADGVARLEIRDTGPGIREDVRDRLFTPFVTTRDNGTGLGLALSQRLIERAGGELQLAEARDGTCFRVTLPLAQPQRAAAE